MKFRQRIGPQGVQTIETLMFERLRAAGVIKNDAALMDSSSLPNNLVYPNDVDLLYKAFEKMASFAKTLNLPPWWDHSALKKRFRAFSMNKKQERLAFLLEFDALFRKACRQFKKIARGLENAVHKKKADHWLDVFQLLRRQTKAKLSGQTHIKDRIVSLDELDARPIQKGKAFPSCEFGSTNPMSFNRQGFMVTCDLFQGQPSDKTLFETALTHYQRRLRGTPALVITDKGFRSQHNFKVSAAIPHVCLGKLEDVQASQREFCKSARSATEGFIAVAKNLRGFGKSLYRGLRGDKIWAALCQAAYNLKKFLQLYRQEAYEESVLLKLGVWIG